MCHFRKELHVLRFQIIIIPYSIHRKIVMLFQNEKQHHIFMFNFWKHINHSPTSIYNHFSYNKHCILSKCSPKIKTSSIQTEVTTETGVKPMRG